MSSFTTPFWNEMTAVSVPSSGRIAVAAVAVSQSFTPNSTRSTAPTSRGSALARASGRFRSPLLLFTDSPRSRMAARCAPRAMKVTSQPLRASFAPK